MPIGLGIHRVKGPDIVTRMLARNGYAGAQSAQTVVTGDTIAS